MFIQFILGVILIGITVFVHALVIDLIMRVLSRYSLFLRRSFYRHWKAIAMILTIIGLFGALIFAIWLWAIVFYLVDHAYLTTFEAALYYSTSSFTTVGFGDVILGVEWRLLGSFEAANGLILFGWSTAFIFEVMQKLYKDDAFGKN